MQYNYVFTAFKGAIIFPGTGIPKKSNSHTKMDIPIIIEYNVLYLSNTLTINLFDPKGTAAKIIIKKNPIRLRF